MLRGPREGLPDWGEFFLVCHLHQVNQVSEVRAKVICHALILFLVPNPLVLKPHLPQLHCRLSGRFGNMGSFCAVDAWVKAGQVDQE